MTAQTHWPADWVDNEQLRSVSNRLVELRDRYAMAGADGCYLLGEEIAWLTAELATLTALARRLENEISARRWNEQGRLDRQTAAIAACRDPASSVILLPIVPRPLPAGDRS